MKNFIEGTKVFRSKYPACDNCYVHSGFYASYNDLSDDMMECAINLKEKYPIA